MKIAVLLPDLQPGGAEIMHLNMAQIWLDNGCQVDLVLMNTEGGLLSTVDPRINVVDLNVSRIRSLLGPLKTYLKNKKPDVFLAAMWPLTSITVITWLLSGRISKLFISDHTQLSISCVKELNTSSLVLRLWVGLTYPFVNGIIAVSEGVKADLCRIGRLSPSSIRVVYNPAAKICGSTSSTATNINPGWRSSKYRILAVGTLKEQKDHATLIRAFSSLVADVDAQLVILGAGPELDSLKRLVVQLGLTDRVLLNGYTANTDVWYRTADLFVLSSRWEGFANVIVEAMEHGVPIVSTDCPSGPSEILCDGLYGTLVPVGDVPALAIAIEHSLEADHSSDALKNRAKNFSVDKVANEYLSIFVSN